MKLTRYKVLRKIGCDPLTAGTIAFMNYLRGYPAHIIVFMTVVMEFDPDEEC